MTELLRNGFGNLTLIEAANPDKVRRYEYHLSADRLAMEIYVSQDGEEFEKTGDWSLQRVPSPAVVKP